MENKVSFGVKVKEIRENRGLTIEALHLLTKIKDAEGRGVSTGRISEIESDTKVNVTVRTVQLLGEALGVDYKELLE